MALFQQNGWFMNALNKPFGYIQKKSQTDKDEEKILNTNSVIAVDVAENPAQIIDANYAITSSFNQVDSFANQSAIINEWRNMALDSTVDQAVNDIVDSMVSVDDVTPPISLDLEKVELSDNTKDKIMDEFDYILNLMNFETTAFEKTRQWYIDGRYIYHCVVDEKNPAKGILKLSNLDPRAVRKFLEVKKEIDPKSKVEVITDQQSYYIYNPMFANDSSSATTTNNNQLKASLTRPGQVLKISDDAIVFAHSGIVSPVNGMVLSHLEKARKPLNNLKMMKDARVVYSITRAAQKRIFYVDVGNLPPKQAEMVMNKVMNEYRTKVSYDTSTGTVKGTPFHVSMLEDYFLPRRDGTRGTEIGTLPAGDGLGNMEEVLFFQKELYMSLNVPRSRLEGESAIVLGGTGAEISRDEWHFDKFVHRLRRRYSALFSELLKKQLILKKITTEEDWDSIIGPNLKYVFASETYMKEQREMDQLLVKLAVIDEVEKYVGIYFSRESVQRDILKRTDEQINLVQKQIDQEKKDGVITEPEIVPDEQSGGTNDTENPVHAQVVKKPKVEKPATTFTPMPNPLKVTSGE